MWKDLRGEIDEMFDVLVGCGFFEEDTGYAVIERHGKVEGVDRAQYKREWNQKNVERERARKRAWAKTPAGLEAKRKWKQKRKEAA